MSSAVVSTSAAPGRPFIFDSKAVPKVSLPPEPEAGEGRPPQRVRSSELAKADPRLAHITPASRLDIRPAPEMVSSGVPAIDALTGGLPRGCLTEICGPASSGRTTLLLAALAAASRRGEFCVVVDASDALDPYSAVAAGVELDHLLWVRCSDHPALKSRAKQRRTTSSASFVQEAGAREAEAREVEASSQAAFDFGRTNSPQSWHRLEQVLRATDLLLESGGFGLIVLDLGDIPPQAARRIPLTTWFRFRRAIEHTPTALLAIEQHAIAGSCSSLRLQLGSPSAQMLRTERAAAERRKNAAHGPSTSLRVNSSRGPAIAEEEAPEGRKKICVGEQSVIDFPFVAPTHAQLLTGLDITAELIRSRLDRKPARSVMFATKTAWAG
jgi:hypothetical protein